MAVGIWVEFPAGAMTAEGYDQINARVQPPGNLPPGLIFHTAGPSPNGGWRIIDAWESREHFDRNFQQRVLPAIVGVFGEAAAQGPMPEIVDWPLHNHNNGPSL